MRRLAKWCCGILLLLMTLALGALPSPAVAQPESHPPSGVRIRLRLDESGNSWQHGILLRANRDSLWYRSLQEDDTLAVGRSNVSQIQVFDGRTSHAQQGALIGLGVGAAVGVAYGLANQGEGSDTYTVGALFLSVGFFGASGLLTGALVGALVRGDKWGDISKPGLSVQGSKDSVRLSFGFGPPLQGGSR